MRGGVVLCLDEATDEAVRELWALVEELRGKRASGRQLPPHITLLLAEGLDTPAFGAGLAALAAAQAPFPVHLSAVASFFGSGGVLYLAPSMTVELALLQHRLVDLAIASGASVWKQFAHGHWMPHTTLAVGLADETISAGIAAVRERTAGLRGSAVSLVPFTLDDGGAVAGHTFWLGQAPQASE